MSESSEPLDETERLQVNLEDDVRAFLLSCLSVNQMGAKQRAKLRAMGIDIRRLSRPSYIAVDSCCLLPGDPPEQECYVGAEGVMVHKDEPFVHLAFKCDEVSHEMHYTKLMLPSIIEMAKAMESVWPGSITRALYAQPGKMIHLDAEGAERILKAINEMDDEDEDFDEDVDLDEDFDEDIDDDDDLYL